MTDTIKKWGMLIDSSKCIGCHSCTVACQNQNELPPRDNFNRIEEREYGKFPNFSRRFLPVQCQHCDNPPCVKVCPVGASYKRQDGVVMVDAQKCIGCKYCLLSCPYNVRVISEEYGHVHKCNFCIEMVLKGEKPACVTTCPMGVRVFGDLNDPGGEISIALAKVSHIRLLKELNTKPSIYYVIK
ncbi:MAG: 4Fe-4S dicluster domain-containing protein [Nitrospirae bacterium YQR-1]